MEYFVLQCSFVHPLDEENNKSGNAKQRNIAMPLAMPATSPRSLGSASALCSYICIYCRDCDDLPCKSLRFMAQVRN
jgi:hypothetical protein